MATHSLVLFALFLVTLWVLAYPLGIYLAKIEEGESIRGLNWMKKTGKLLLPSCRRPGESEMGWKAYATALLVFNALGALTVYVVQRLQAWLPLNPQGFANVSPDSSFNTAISFTTNTNWQGYGGESMSYLTQVLALTVQNFLSAATGMAVAYALIRGFKRHSVKSIGNFWHDITRSTLYVLLPLSMLFAMLVVSQGVIQNFSAYKEVSLMESVTYQLGQTDPDGQPVKDENGNQVLESAITQVQTLAMGPVASQEAIKLLGTNGGGFFNANSAQCSENPTPLTNFAEMLAILLIPAGLCFAFGRMVGDIRQGWAVLTAMTVIFVVMTTVVLIAEQQAHPELRALGINPDGQCISIRRQYGGQGNTLQHHASALFAAVTTAASCGAVNTIHDSLTPLGGMVPMLLMQLGEVVFGGVGSGLYGMLLVRHPFAYSSPV